MKIIEIKQIEIYVTQSGKRPFVEWLENLKDKTVRYRVKERLDRLILGNYGNFKFIQERLLELRFDFGPGYRVYCGEDKEKVVLLQGGDKSTQKRDIQKAIKCWNDYISR